MEIELGIYWSTLAVADCSLAEPFNDWKAAHVLQGFSWREGSVSFSTFTDFGTIKLKVTTQAHYQLNPKASRVILLPFRVKGGAVQLSDLINTHRFDLVNGDYALLFEAYQVEEAVMWCQLTFVPSVGMIEPQILRADPLLSPEYPLLMEAVPA